MKMSMDCWVGTLFQIVQMVLILESQAIFLGYPKWKNHELSSKTQSSVVLQCLDCIFFADKGNLNLTC